MKVIYECDPTSASGYAKAARNHMRALLESGVEVALVSKRKDNLTIELDDFWKTNFQKVINTSPHDAVVKIWHETPEFYNPDPSIKNIALLAWETSKIPSVDLHGMPTHNWVKQLNKMDAVWVPCSQNKEALFNSGVTTKIYVVPHPVYFGEPKEEIKPLVPKDSPFTALSIFQWQPRKDPLGLLLGVYKSDFPLKLLLKTYGSGFGVDNNAIYEKIKKIKASFHQTPIPFVVPVLDKLSEMQIQQLYRSADVYIATAKGEGACLPALEAMAAGIPVIAPASSAFLDFVKSTTGYLVTTKEEPVHGMDHIPWYSPDQNWWPIDISSLVWKLSVANQDRQEDVSFEGRTLSALEVKGIEAKRFVMSNFSGQGIGERMKNLLESVAQCSITI